MRGEIKWTGKGRVYLALLLLGIGYLAANLRGSSWVPGETEDRLQKNVSAKAPGGEKAGQGEEAGEEPVREREEGEEASLFSSPVIVHALGGFDDHTYLNSPAGFWEAYGKGERLFEVDLTKTGDGFWVCRHSWHDPMGQWEEGEQRLTLEEFLSSPLYGEYEPLSYEGLLDLAGACPDAWFILDTKNYSLSSYSYVQRGYSELVQEAISAGKEAFLDRFLPEIYNEAMFYAIEAVHSFPGYVYSFWEQTGPEELAAAALFCEEQGIGAVCLGAGLQESSDMEPFLEKGIPVYYFTVNDAEQALALRGEGAAGVVSDFLSVEDLGGF